jgi:polyhydroxyalkanoate synthesis regulator phasin
MPAAKSPSSEGSGESGASSEVKSQGAAPKRASVPSRTKSRRSAPRKTTVHAGKPVAPGRASFGEDLANRILKPLDVVLLTRERIQATLDEAADRGRVTRTDANELVSELLKRGRQQTDDLLADLEGRLGRGREQLESVTRRARRTVAAGVGVSAEFPISDYDELTVAQVEVRLSGLTPPQLRKVRDYERSHANRKSVLAAAEKLLG